MCLAVVNVGAACCGGFCVLQHLRCGLRIATHSESLLVVRFCAPKQHWQTHPLAVAERRGLMLLVALVEEVVCGGRRRHQLEQVLLALAGASSFFPGLLRSP